MILEKDKTILLEIDKIVYVSYLDSFIIYFKNSLSTLTIGRQELLIINSSEINK